MQLNCNLTLTYLHKSSDDHSALIITTDHKWLFPKAQCTQVIKQQTRYTRRQLSAAALHAGFQEAAPAASTDLGTASSLNAAVSAASSRRPVLQSTSSKKLSRFAVESQRLPPTEGLPPLAPATPMATPMATRGDSVTSQVNAAPGASPARTTTDEGEYICVPMHNSQAVRRVLDCLTLYHSR